MVSEIRVETNGNILASEIVYIYTSTSKLLAIRNNFCHADNNQTIELVSGNHFSFCDVIDAMLQIFNVRPCVKRRTPSRDEFTF